jgi:hypothetical protein
VFSLTGISVELLRIVVVKLGISLYHVALNNDITSKKAVINIKLSNGKGDIQRLLCMHLTGHEKGCLFSGDHLQS